MRTIAVSRADCSDAWRSFSLGTGYALPVGRERQAVYAWCLLDRRVCQRASRYHVAAGVDPLGYAAFSQNAPDADEKKAQARR